METVWYCCRCLCGGMTTKLNPRCLYCEEDRCPNCPWEPTRSQEVEKRDTLYSRPKRNGMVTESEALCGAHHEFEALQETTHSSTERASLLRAESSNAGQIPFGYPATTKGNQANISEPVPVIHFSHNETGPHSGVGSEISRASLVYGDRECTPLSCPDTSDPHSNNDKDASFDDIPWGEIYLNLGLDRQSDRSSADPNPQNQRDELLRNTGGEEANQTEPIDLNLEISYEGADAVEPQRHQCVAPGFPIIGANEHDYLSCLGIFDNYYPSPWIDNDFQHSNEPCQLPTGESLAAPSETSSSRVAPSPPRHDGGDRRHITRKGKTSQAITACNSCLSTPQLDGKPLACVFYKFNPRDYFGCSSKDFKNIGHLRQHLKNDHQLGDHHCKRCWVSFDNEGSLKAHTGCQPMGGIPVNDLEPISKARDVNPNTKWCWIWKKLFGENTPLPHCPYPHPIQDLERYTLGNLYQDLQTKAEGSNLSLDQIEKAISEQLIDR